MHKLLALGGPLNGQIVPGYSAMALNAEFMPESHKQICLRFDVNIELEMRLIVTQYHRERIHFDHNGLTLVGEVWLWEELDKDDPTLMRLAFGHLIAGAIQPKIE